MGGTRQRCFDGTIEADLTSQRVQLGSYLMQPADGVIPRRRREEVIEIHEAAGATVILGESTVHY